jgi:hypothetical protein
MSVQIILTNTNTNELGSLSGINMWLGYATSLLEMFNFSFIFFILDPIYNATGDNLKMLVILVN